MSKQSNIQQKETEMSSNKENNGGKTELMMAVDYGKKDIVDMLLAHNCNLDLLADEDRVTQSALADADQ